MLEQQSTTNYSSVFLNLRSRQFQLNWLKLFDKLYNCSLAKKVFKF